MLIKYQRKTFNEVNKKGAKLILVIIVILCFIQNSITVNAQEDGGEVVAGDNIRVTTEYKDDAQEDLFIQQEQPQGLRAEDVRTIQNDRRTALDARSQERMLNLSANVSNRFDALIARLVKITERLESRTQKLSDQGYDLSEAKEQLAFARLALNSASTEISQIDNAVSSAITSENVRAKWSAVKSIYINTQTQLITAKQYLGSVLMVLKLTIQNPVTVESETSTLNNEGAETINQLQGS